ncbi:sigma-54-dependent transcriptional regulator [Geoalkalibacter sp.]|uniref:sigma-54-dependent transcriptional regulator n=1 Tax=Geoalkalibacter sp. TaxID=3041440 RepID=UPI00272ECFC9|nr:sigma-54 dependent transcriptional regulator [Geoalkalibacter sp.]
MSHVIYLCDDEEGMLRYLRKTVAEWGFEARSHNSPTALLSALEKEDEGGVLLLDIRMPEMDGLEVLARVREKRPDLGVIMMTGYGTIDSAVEAIKQGAFDYLTKPFPEERLETAIAHCLERQRLLAENRALKKDLHGHLLPGEIIYRSRRFREVHDLARRAAAGDVSVLLLGESGTGKELVAAAIHYASPRAERRFLALNCAALTETLLESQLFGHVRGAFTGAAQNQKGLLEEAHGGTLFLDEVGELSPALQAKLLRVLQEGEFIPVGATRAKRVDVRFVAATNKNLEDMVARGAFREDLFYRLNVFALRLPPLRERPEDVEVLAEHFLRRAAMRLGRPLRGIAPEALAALRDYAWPGNVRELQNVIERGVILAQGDALSCADLPLQLSRPQAPAMVAEDDGQGPVTLADAERVQIQRILRRTGWNKSRAARLLDITRRTLDRKIQDYHLTPDEG